MIPEPPKPPIGKSVPDEVARGLRAFDPHMAMLWCDRSKRWWVQSWMERAGFWCKDMPWQGDEGEYRDLPATADPIIAAIRTKLVDMSALGATSSERYRKLDAMFAGTREAIQAKKRRMVNEAGAEYRKDLAARHYGIRQTFGPGYIRSRGGLLLGSPNHRKFIAGTLDV